MGVLFERGAWVGENDRSPLFFFYDIRYLSSCMILLFCFLNLEK